MVLRASTSHVRMAAQPMASAPKRAVANAWTAGRRKIAPSPRAPRAAPAVALAALTSSAFARRGGQEPRAMSHAARTGAQAPGYAIRASAIATWAVTAKTAASYCVQTPARDTASAQPMEAARATTAGLASTAQRKSVRSIAVGALAIEGRPTRMARPPRSPLQASPRAESASTARVCVRRGGEARTVVRWRAQVVMDSSAPATGRATRPTATASASRDGPGTGALGLRAATTDA